MAGDGRGGFEGIGEIIALNNQDRWYVGCTIPRGERIAKMQLDEVGLKSVLLLRERAPTRQKPINIEPIWPGYIFVQATFLPERVTAVRHLIRTEDGYAVSVPSGVVEGWLSVADDDGLVEHYTPPERASYRPGDNVRIVYGPLAGAFVVVAKHTGNRVRAFLACLGGQVIVDLALEQVALAISADAATPQWDSPPAKRALAYCA